MRKKHRPGTSRTQVRRLGTGLLATVCAFFLLLVMTTAAFANTVNINDRAGVLDQSRVRSAASSLSYPVDIYTINNFSGSTSSFDQTAKGSVNSSNKIVIAIDTVHKHLTIVGGSSVSLTNNQYADARNAFANSFRSDSNYTSATVAALQSLQGASSGGALSVPGVNGGGFSWGSTLCCVGLLVVAAFVLFGVLRRRRGGGGGLFGGGGGGGLFGRRPNYGPNYNQGGYPQNYGPNYPGGYNQNQGMNPLAAGGLGAAAGGLVGYELGKQAGEHDERGDQGNFGSDQGGFGGGASGDFGGGDNNGGGGASGDFGGGDNSGGGFGGGGGDFGGGGGGDFGGGGGGGSF